ncbi:aminoacyl-tRNA hydrolase [Coxiella endosymbiont of Amblyomma sculptum]|uniref:aminoacyl-tRNA hydrolase n=1 Tax=Coxiella endosymbiont of Amblyomma sculptum TaxID=2487929 RepID=UPI00132F34B4|nr:aminoacyl-tRNA hydrolase [Coxiella endosymbiont of Amblyomma sculptum]QHG92242.1 aminoacyl-tRNA hydrolase [Coxiella endosymbiont of Amblyomma sculptum]
MKQSIKLIVGLGNPGNEYSGTRHNVGIWFIEILADRERRLLHKKDKLYGLIGKWNHCWLFKPSVYMNQSGLAVAAVVQFYKLNPQKILITHDELDLTVGDIRLKKNGGHGGHNGLRSITQYLGTSDFYRLRVGIGRPEHREQITSYVLGLPSKKDRKAIFMALEKGLDVIEKLLIGKFQKMRLV